jgi:hypothetical protein
MKIDKQFVLRQIAGDYVIIPTGKTTLDFNGLITVNEQGAFLWEKLSQDTTQAELVAALLEEYEVDEPTARADVEEFLAILRQCRMLNE